MWTSRIIRSLQADLRILKKMMSRSPAEVWPGWQKLKEEKTRLAQGFSMGSQAGFGRSSNNDNEKQTDNNNEKTISDHQKTDIRFPVSKYDPESYEEERCKEIAEYLGERDMRFILSVLKNHSFQLIEEIYEEIREKENSGKGKPIRNRGAYFNKRIQQMTQYDKQKYTDNEICR